MNPRVSVIITTYNRADLLSRSVHSVLDQDFRDLELIVVNDCSTDNTARVLQSLSEDDARIRVVTHCANRGAGAARNSGIRAARGEYIAFLDDDDEWLPGKLSAQVDLLDRSPPEVGVVYCWFHVFDSQTGERVFVRFGTTATYEGDISEHCLALRQPGPQTILLARTSIVREVMFDETLQAGIDQDFNMRLSQRCHYRLLPQVGVRLWVNHGHSQITHNFAAILAFHKRHLERYAEELQARPATLAHMHSRLGVLYLLKIGSPVDAIREFTRALRTSFWTEMPLYILWFFRRLFGKLSPRNRNRIRLP